MKVCIIINKIYLFIVITTRVIKFIKIVIRIIINYHF